MNKLKKILSVVLSIGLVASTLVLPITAEAANENVSFLYNYTFDDHDGSEGVFGTQGTYQVVAGDSETDARFPKLAAADKLVKLSSGYTGTSVSNTVPGSYMFGSNWSGHNTDGVTHATLQFDFAFTNTYNKLLVYPSGNEAGEVQRYGIYMDTGADTSKPLYVHENSWDKVDTGVTFARFEWHELAIEYNMGGTSKIYFDGQVVDTYDGLTGPGVPYDFDFKFTPDNGAVYLNNMYYYEGAYNANIEKPFYPLRQYDFSDASANDITNTEIADGLMGKDASDKVAHVTGGSATYNWGKYYAEDVVTAEAQVYLDDNSKSFHFYPGSNPKGEDRYGIDIQNGNVRWVNPKNDWTYTTITTVDKDMWHKLAVTWDRTDNTAKYYCDGELIYTATDVVYATEGINQDIRVESGGYFDNFRVYDSAYRGDAAITAASTAKVTVSGTTLSALEGVTFDDLKAAITAYDQVKFYTDATLASETTDVNAANVMLVRYGELFKKYDLNITSPYGTKLVWYDFTDAANATAIGATQTNGLMGKDASDKVAYASAQTSRSFLNSGNTVAITSGVVTYEASIYVPAGSTSIMHLFNGGGNNTRLAMKIQADGTVTIGETVSGAGVWDGVNDAATTYGVAENTWNKFAMELNANNGYAKFYINDNCVKTVNASFTLTAAGTQFAFETTNTYIDNMRMYTAPYVAGEPIAAVTGAVDGVINVAEGTTVAQVKAMVTDGTPEVYTDATLATVASTVADDSVLLIKKGELYKAYTLNVASKYDGALYENKMDDLARVTALTDTTNTSYVAPEIVTNIAGRADNIAKIGTGNANGGVGTWGQVWNTAGVMTVEAMVYNPNHNKVYIYPTNGNLASTANRLGVELSAEGKVGYYHNSFTAVDTGATYNMDKWTKVAYTLDYTVQTMKIYIDGVLVYTYSNVGMDSANFGKDIRFTPSNNNGTYLDNLRVYEGAYKGDDAITFTAASGISLADGVIKVADGTTADAIAATLNADSVAIYADATGAATSAVADGAVVIANKGELYQTYTLDVLGLYDDSYLLVGFESQAIVNEGTGFGTLSSWLYANNRTEDGNTVSRKDEVTTSYVTGLGGKDSTVYKVVSPATETQRNVRFQTGYGNPSTHVTEAGVYTYEADVYRGTTENSGASIMVKMRNTTDTNNMQITMPSPFVANRWYKLAITVDTVNKTVKGYVNGVDATSSLTFYGTDYDADTYEAGTLVFNGKDYTVVSDQVNVNFSESKTAEVVTATDNMRLYAGAYRGTTAPSMAASVTMAANSTVADVIAETGADFVVDANGNKVTSTAAAVATGYQAVKVDGEMFGYTAIEVEVAATDVVFSPLAVGTPYTGKDGVEYVFVAVTTGTVDASLYYTFRVTDGVEVKEMALDELMGTTLSGEVQIGVLVMNVPAANKDNFKAKLVLAD